MIEMECHNRVSGEKWVLRMSSEAINLNEALQDASWCSRDPRNVSIDGITIDGVRLTSEEIAAYPPVNNENFPVRVAWSKSLFDEIQVRAARAAAEHLALTRPLTFGL